MVAKVLLLVAVALALFRFFALKPLFFPSRGGSFLAVGQRANELVTAQATLDIVAGGLAVVGLILWFRKS